MQIQSHKVTAHAPHCECGIMEQLKEHSRISSLGTRLPQ